MGNAIDSIKEKGAGFVKAPAATISRGFNDAAGVVNNPILNPASYFASGATQAATGLTPGQQLMAGAAGGAAAYGASAYGGAGVAGGAGGMSAGTGLAIGGGLNLFGGYLGSEAAKDAAKTQAESADRASANSLIGMRESNALQKQIYDQNRSDQSPWRDTGRNSLNKLSWQMGIRPDQPKTLAQISADYANKKPYAQALLEHPDMTQEQYSTLLGQASQQAFSSQQDAYVGDESDFGSLNKKFSMADFHADPNYQFNIDQGNRGIEQSAAARGGVLSGATMKALNQFGQNTANQEYGTQYNRFETDKANQFNRLSGIAGTGQTSVNQTGQAGQNYANGVSNNNNNGYGQISSNIIGAGNAAAASQVGQANAWSNAIGTGVNMYNQNNMLNKMYPSGGSGIGSSGSYANNNYLTS